MAVYYNDFNAYCCDVLRMHVTAGDLPQGDVDGRDIKLVDEHALGDYGAVHLCCGIGGWPLGLSWAGVTDLYRVLTASWPCQPHSGAGKRRGSADDRELWPEILRVIRGYRPRWFLGENVRDILTSDEGRYFGTILKSLAEVGYDAEWQVIPASAVGAPHKRERIWIVAYPAIAGLEGTAGESLQGRSGRLASSSSDVADTMRRGFQLDRGSGPMGRTTGEGQGQDEERQRFRDAVGGGSTDVADADFAGLEGWHFYSERAGELLARTRRDAEQRTWRSNADVLRVAARLPGWVDRIKAVGNSVVPQIPMLLGHLIVETENAYTR